MPEKPTKGCIQRLQKEFRTLQNSTHEHYDAAPNPNNILQWLFVLTGPPDTPYHRGRYIGEINFPPQYPFAPPSVCVFTPTGRFVVGEKICMTNTSYHAEMWSPYWNVDTIINALIAFWTSEERAYGTMYASEEERQAMARNSVSYNVSVLAVKYKKMLPRCYEADVARVGREKEEAERKREEILRNSCAPSAAGQTGNSATLGAKLSGAVAAINHHLRKPSILVAAALLSFYFFVLTISRPLGVS